MTKHRPNPNVSKPVLLTWLCEADVAEGLERLVAEQLPAVNPRLRVTGYTSGAVRFVFQGNLSELWEIPIVQSVYLVQSYAVPRPRGLLGDQNLRSLQHQVTRVLDSMPHGRFASFYLGAAGADSSIMRRIADTIRQQTGLVEADANGDLLVRIRPSGDRAGWETLVRITPRPSATRAWRACNLEGALNASVAFMMNVLTTPQTDDVYVNIACGSGTLGIERMRWGAAAQIIGVDISREILSCAQQNTSTAGVTQHFHLIEADAGRLPLPDASTDALTCDLPFGQRIGSHQQNTRLYPAVLREAARIAKPDARFIVITHEVKLMETTLQNARQWLLESVTRITLRGLHPRIYVLRRAK